MYSKDELGLCGDRDCCFLSLPPTLQSKKFCTDRRRGFQYRKIDLTVKSLNVAL